MTIAKLTFFGVCGFDNLRDFVL